MDIELSRRLLRRHITNRRRRRRFVSAAAGWYHGGFLDDATFRDYWRRRGDTTATNNWSTASTSTAHPSTQGGIDLNDLITTKKHTSLYIDIIFAPDYRDSGDANHGGEDGIIYIDVRYRIYMPADKV